MNLGNPNYRKLKVRGISAREALRRFESALMGSWDGRKIQDSGQYVILHVRIPFPPDFESHVVVYSSDIIGISSSANAPGPAFDKVATQIGEVAQNSTISVKKERPVTILRASNLLNYASKLNLNDDNERMVVVVIADTANEIMLTEIMQTLGFQGPPLEEGVPQKIKRIQEKGHPLHKPAEIKNARVLRNEIVHKGNIPDKGQAERCLKNSMEFYESL